MHAWQIMSYLQRKAFVALIDRCWVRLNLNVYSGISFLIEVPKVPFKQIRVVFVNVRDVSICHPSQTDGLSRHVWWYNLMSDGCVESGVCGLATQCITLSLHPNFLEPHHF